MEEEEDSIINKAASNGYLFASFFVALLCAVFGFFNFVRLRP